jgi:hypothetical protein
VPAYRQVGFAGFPPSEGPVSEDLYQEESTIPTSNLEIKEGAESWGYPAPGCSRCLLCSLLILGSEPPHQLAKMTVITLP